jgi:hypothetical protein
MRCDRHRYSAALLKLGAIPAKSDKINNCKLRITTRVQRCTGLSFVYNMHLLFDLPEALVTTVLKLWVDFVGLGDWTL